MRRFALLLPLVLLLVACGDEPVERPQATFQGTFSAAMQACHDADLDRLWPLLTLRAQEGVKKTLRHWQRRFQDPEEGPFLRGLIEERLGPLSEEAFTRAATGTIQDAFQLMIRADPRPAKPRQLGIEIDKDGATVRIRYVTTSGGQEREDVATLVQRDSGWYLDAFWL